MLLFHESLIRLSLNSVTFSDTSISSMENSSNCPIYNFSRPKYISNALDDYSIFPFIPYNIRLLICDYDDRYQNYNELHERVITRLILYPLKSNVDINLNFDNVNFAGNFNRILSKIKIPHGDSFWNDLSSLLFKWMLHMKQTFKNDFNQILKDEIEEDYNSLNQRILPILSPLNVFNFYNLNFSQDEYSQVDLCPEFWKLMFVEFLEMGRDLFSIFQDAIKEFYFMTGSCQILKNKHFNGNFDNNIVLKIMIYKYDIFGEIKKRCFKHPNSNLNLDISSNPYKTHYEKLKIKNIFQRIIKDFAHGHNHINRKIVEIYKRNNLRFSICDSGELLILLKNLKRISSEDFELLKLRILKRIVGFPAIWDSEQFRIYLKEFQESNKDEYFKLKLSNFLEIEY